MDIRDSMLLSLLCVDEGERMKVHYYAENNTWKVWLPLWNWTGSEELDTVKEYKWPVTFQRWFNSTA